MLRLLCQMNPGIMSHPCPSDISYWTWTPTGPASVGSHLQMSALSGPVCCLILCHLQVNIRPQGCREQELRSLLPPTLLFHQGLHTSSSREDHACPHVTQNMSHKLTRVVGFVCECGCASPHVIQPLYNWLIRPWRIAHPWVNSPVSGQSSLSCFGGVRLPSSVSLNLMEKPNWCVCVCTSQTHSQDEQLLELIRLTNSEGGGGGGVERVRRRRRRENNTNLSLCLQTHVVIARRENSGPWTFSADVAPLVLSLQLALSALCCTARGNEVQCALSSPPLRKNILLAPLFVPAIVTETRGCVRR